MSHLSILIIKLTAMSMAGGDALLCVIDRRALRNAALAYDLLDLWKVDEKHSNLNGNMGLDNTDVISCSYQDTSNNTTDDICVNDEVDSILKGDQFKMEDVQETVKSTNDCEMRDTKLLQLEEKIVQEDMEKEKVDL
ncbi:hypothetical protein E2C01_026039 [Portunus trituberculatus]|uniref:Uncharacterized protein n=1 Tax=Portunus trituberculatus TaxID=210409 RepID=A0A5B7EF09_PORTR|nr:hypothetical protein [Portunus trituberculatus]